VSSRSKFIAAVDIGTSKISVVVGEQHGTEVSLIGRGECPSKGVVKGGVVDFKAASECTHAAIEQAEREAGERVNGVFLAQTGGHLEGFYNEGSVTVRAADNMIDADDIAAVCDDAMAKELPPGRKVVHHIRRPFRIDGRLHIVVPDEIMAQRLEVGYWTVHGDQQRIADHLHVIRGFDLLVHELILSSLASGHMVTTPEERQGGVLVLDIGAGTTDFVLYRDGLPLRTGVVAVGGEHLTSDLTLGLRLKHHEAEKMKLRFGRALAQPRDKAERVWLNGDFAIGDKHFPRHTIEQITEARIRELFEIVKQKLGNAFTPETCVAGVVLTGGTAKLPAIAEAAAKSFGVAAHLGEVPVTIDERLRDVGYHTSLGLLYYGVSAQHEKFPAAPRGHGLLRWFKRLFSRD
jgi:cell division protein FtsA